MVQIICNLHENPCLRTFPAHLQPKWRLNFFDIHIYYISITEADDQALCRHRSWLFLIFICLKEALENSHCIYNNLNILFHLIKANYIGYEYKIISRKWKIFMTLKKHYPNDHVCPKLCMYSCSFHLHIFWSTKKMDSLWRIRTQKNPSPIKDEDWMNHKDYHHQSRISKMAINSVSVGFFQYNVSVKCYLTRTLVRLWQTP